MTKRERIDRENARSRCAGDLGRLCDELGHVQRSLCGLNPEGDLHVLRLALEALCDRAHGAYLAAYASWGIPMPERWPMPKQEAKP